MVEIVPAVIAPDFSVIHEKVARLEGVSDWAHLDVADGLFVADYTWQGAEQLSTLVGRIKLEVHLMIENPESEIDEWFSLADRVLVHPESTENLEAIMVNRGPELGLAILLETPLEPLAAVLGKVKFVQLMSIRRLGHHGEPFDEAVLEKIKFLQTHYPSVKISVDGGINLETGRRAVAAGATRLVVGSGIWLATDPIAALRTYQSIFNDATVRSPLDPST